MKVTVPIDIQTPGKVRLLNNLKNETYCAIGKSEVHGIGVIAIRDIPSGTNPFKLPNHVVRSEIIDISPEDVEDFPEEIQDRIKDFFVKAPHGLYPVHVNGLNGINISFYLNHSEEPNVGFDDNTKIYGNKFRPFMTLREIKKGEELVWDYKASESSDLKEQYSFIKGDGIIKKTFKKLFS